MTLRAEVKSAKDRMWEVGQENENLRKALRDMLYAYESVDALGTDRVKAHKNAKIALEDNAE